MIEIVLDTETTGLSVKQGHRIVEIGCVELKDRMPTKNKFHYLLNPERKVSKEAFEVHGYSDEFLSDKKKFSEIADKFLTFIDNKKLIIHNSEFDLSHLNNELELIGKQKIDKIRVIDTLDLAKEKFPGSQINLDSLCKKFRIDNSRRKKHNAIIDCELLAKVYVNLIDEKEPVLNFSNFTIDKIQGDLKNNIKYSKKIAKITPEQIKIHKKFLKENFKKNFFE